MAVTDLELPSGHVTFVFTDIEGSTKLLRALGSGYETVLEDHRSLLRTAWDDNHGHELGTEGDSFLVAFADASSAMAACVAAQRGLAAHPDVPQDRLDVLKEALNTAFASAAYQQYLRVKGMDAVQYPTDAAAAWREQVELYRSFFQSPWLYLTAVSR